MTLSVRHLGTRFGEGKMALETTRLYSSVGCCQQFTSTTCIPAGVGLDIWIRHETATWSNWPKSYYTLLVSEDYLMTGPYAHAMLLLGA
jgi:hypothetical protein